MAGAEIEEAALEHGQVSSVSRLIRRCFAVARGSAVAVVPAADGPPDVPATSASRVLRN